jgi:hypothetical protein
MHEARHPLLMAFLELGYTAFWVALEGVTSAELAGLAGGSGCTGVLQVWFCCDA